MGEGPNLDKNPDTSQPAKTDFEFFEQNERQLAQLVP